MNAPLPPDALREKVRAAVAATPAPMSPRSTRMATAVVALAAVTAFGVLWLRHDFAQLPMTHLVLSTATLGLLALVAFVLVTAPGRHGLGAPMATLSALAIVTAPIYALATVAMPLSASDARPRTTSCFTMMVVSGFVALGAMTWALRRSVPAASVARGAAIGATAGAWAAFAQHLHCPSGDRMHLLIGHAAPIAAFALLGMLISPRVLRP